MATTNSHTNSGINRISITDSAGNVIGINAQQINVAAPENITISGGANGDVLTSDGTGNIYWNPVGSNIVVAALMNSGSNVTVLENSNITFTANSVANVMVVAGNGITINRNTVLPAIGNVTVDANIKGSVLFSDGNGGLRSGGDFLIPETGTSLGWVVANGLRLYRSGDGTSGQVASWRSATTTWRPQSVAVLHDGMPTITGWQKIHMNQTALYALGNNGVLYSQGIDSGGQQGNTVAAVTNEVLTPITQSTIYGAGITVLNFWSYNDNSSISTGRGAVFVNVDVAGFKRSYMFGANDTGVLGNGTIGTNNQVPTLITELNGKTITSVSFLEHMIMIVTLDGEVWGCGSNNYGQLGLGNTTTATAFSRATKSDGSFFTNATSVTINSNKASTSTGFNSVFVLCDDGTLWGCGYNGGTAQQVLGINSALNFITRFQQLSIPATLTKYSGNGLVGAALDSGGNLWSWGVNQSGFWGIGSGGQIVGTPRIIQRDVSDFWMVSRLRGAVYGIIWIDTENRTWGTGSNQYGYLGVSQTNNTTDVMNPTTIPFKSKGEYPVNVLSLGVCNSDSDPALYYVATMFFTNMNRIYVSGRNQYAASVLPSNADFNSQRPMEITNLL